MAPRGRPGKNRTARIFAAIDAMAQFGFPQEEVQSKVTELLKVYGGDDGYPFIEADAYNVLLEALLADQEKSKSGDQNQLKVVEGETSRVNKTVKAEEAKNDHSLAVAVAAPSVGFIDIPVCISSPRASPLPPIMTASLPPPLSPKKYALPPPPPPSLPALDAPSLPPPAVDALPPRPGNAQHGRKPCYGWIDDDDHQEPQFIMLTSSRPPPLSAIEECVTVAAGTKKVRRHSRWDVKPDDV